MIVSVSNPKVKQVVLWQNKARERRKDGVFVAEGVKMFEEAPAAWIQEVYVSQELGARLGLSDEKSRILRSLEPGKTDLLHKLQRTGYELVSDEVFGKMSDTLTPQGILTVLKQPVYSLEDLLKEPEPLFVILENIQDPGNLGTILRTGEGAGVTGVIMSADTADIFNPKTVRSTMGSVYRVPFLYTQALVDTLQRLHAAGITTYAAHLKGRDYYDGFSLKGPTAFLIGNEGRGLKDDTARLAMHWLKIPMEGKVESLNAAVASALLLYEAHRQRHSLQ